MAAGRVQAALRRVTGRLAEPLRRLSPAAVATALPWAFALGALEVLGRTSPSDSVDVLGVLAVLVLIGRAGVRWERQGKAVWERWKERFAHWKPAFGLDLRGTPALPVRAPAVFAVPLLAMLVAAGALWIGRGSWPSDARELVRGVSGLVYLLGLTVLWSVMLLGVIVMPGGGLAILNAFLLDSPRWRGRRRRVLTIVGAGLVLAIAAGCVLLGRGWGLVAVCLVPLPTVLAHRIPAGHPLRVVWRPGRAARGSRGPFWTSVESSALAEVLFFSAGGAVLALAAGGERLDGPGSADTSLTALLGLVFTWSTALTLGPLFTWSALQMAVCRWHSPARSMPGARRDRRGVQRHRRELRRGLARLFKHGAGRTFEKGEGFLVAPHLWYVVRLSRDTDEEDCWFVGPPYHRVLSRAARHHLYEVLRDVEVDLFFVEDGVGHRRFLGVLRQLFEFHDLFGARPLEERHFAGLPGVRVMIHEHDLEDERPWAPSGYEEPDYEDLGRARIVHVFRDRGGSDERARAPGGGDAIDAPPKPVLLPG